MCRKAGVCKGSARDFANNEGCCLSTINPFFTRKTLVI